jgi:hypothetical protein
MAKHRCKEAFSGRQDAEQAMELSMLHAPFK